MAFVRPADRVGIPEVRSGQTIGEGFLSSVISSFTNITQQPITLVVFTFASVVGFSSTVGIPILAVIYRILATKAATSKFSGILNFLANTFLFLNDHSDIFASLIVVFIAPLCKRSRKNFVLAFIFVFLMILFYNKATFIESFVSGVFFYLYTQLRDPKHKLVVFVSYLVLMSMIIASSDLVEYDARFDTASVDKDRDTLKQLMGVEPFRAARSVNPTGRKSDVPSSFGTASPTQSPGKK